MIIAAQRIIAGDGESVHANNALHIKDGIIDCIGPPQELRERYPADTFEDYGDATLTPGYIDCHTHLGCYDGVWDLAQYNEYRKGIFGLTRARECFKYGVTTVRDAGSPDNLMETLRRIEASGFEVLPRIFHSNQAIAMTGGHCWAMSIVTEADGIEGLRSVIRRQIRGGADWIKIMTTHRDGTEVEYSQEELNFAVGETHRLGKKCLVHAALQPGLQMAIDARPDCIEHGTFLTVKQAEQMRDNNIYWDPTICSLEYIVPVLRESADSSNPYGAAQLRDCDYYERNARVISKNFAELIATGVKIVAGTDFDTGYCPPSPVGMELRYMAQYGMPPLKAAQTSRNAAEMLGLKNIGLLAEGYTADIAVLKGDPLKDIGAFEDILATYLGGELVYSK